MRRMNLRLAACLAACTVAATLGPTSSAATPHYPWHERVRDAKQFVVTRSGSASFAVTDGTGGINGYRQGVQYSSASLVKAMLLVAYLDQRDVRRRDLRKAERRLLGPMIRVSDNDAATEVYKRVGAGGLQRVARQAGMRRFVPNPVWGGCQVTARDQTILFSRIRSLVPERHREYAMSLLRRIVSYERWGIPQDSPPGWRVYFKGGWFKDQDGWRVHQAGRLELGDRHLAVAVLTRGSPSLSYGAATIAGVTARLLRGYR
jgi:beta-lactamase class A